MGTLIRRHPWRAAVAIVAGLLAYTGVLHGVAYFTPPGTPRLALTFLAVAGQAAVALGLVAALGWWQPCGFTPGRQWRDRWVAWILAIPVFFSLALLTRGVHTGVGVVLVLAALSALVGVNEETYFRGLVLRFLLPRGVGVAIVGSAVLFGIVHAGNLLSPGATGGGVAYQMAAAALIGIFFAGVRLRMNTIWPLILAHALIDFPILATTYPHLRLTTPATQTLVVGLSVYGFFAVIGLALGLTAVRETSAQPSAVQPATA